MSVCALLPHTACTQGFEWYDTTTTTILSNVTFENYKYKQFTTDPNDWWYLQTPHAFRMLSHSDQFKPGGRGFTRCTVLVWAFQFYRFVSIAFRLLLIETTNDNCRLSRWRRE